jgi:hypothetical protein
MKSLQNELAWESAGELAFFIAPIDKIQLALGTPIFAPLFGGASPPACATLRPPPSPRQKAGQWLFRAKCSFPLLNRLSSLLNRREQVLFLPDTSSSNRVGDRVTHGRGADQSGAGCVDVAGAESLGNHGVDGVFDRVGGIFVAEREPQKHCGGEDLGDRIGNALAGDVGSGAAAGLIHAETGVAAGRFPEAGAGQHAERTGNHGHLIAQNVSKKIFSENDIERLRVFDELHRGVIHIQVLEGHIRVVAGGFVHHAAPEDAILEDIRLVD